MAVDRNLTDLGPSTLPQRPNEGKGSIVKREPWVHEVMGVCVRNEFREVCRNGYVNSRELVDGIRIAARKNSAKSLVITAVRFAWFAGLTRRLGEAASPWRSS